MDWQTPAAIGVVLITAAIFVFRYVRQRSKKNGCGGGCSCPVTPVTNSNTIKKS